MGLTSSNDVQDLDLSAIRKKRFRIDGDNNRILELNTSDMNIIVRLRDNYPKLTELANKVAELKYSDETESESEELTDAELQELFDFSTKFESIDNEMRNIIDRIFDSNVSEVCAPSGSMYDLLNGQFRFEHIIDRLTKLYETNISDEYKKMDQRIRKHTDKYTKKK